MSIEILAAIGLFVFGVALGAVLQRSFNGDTGKTKRLEQKLAETQEAYTRYQAEVSSHFMDTARKVQNLNQSYREVHEELAKGASKLCSDDEANDFLSISLDTSNKGQTYDERENDLPNMPMDYAPKETPEDEGTLSESYGLKNADAAANTEETSETQGSVEPNATEQAEPPRV